MYHIMLVCWVFQLVNSYLISFPILSFPRQIKTKVFRGRMHFFFLSLAKISQKKNKIFQKCDENSTTTNDNNKNSNYCRKWNTLKRLYFYLFLLLSFCRKWKFDNAKRKKNCTSQRKKNINLTYYNFFLNMNFFYPNQQNFYHAHSSNYRYI